MVNLPSFLNKKAGFKQFDKENRSSNLDFSDRAPANFVVPLSPSPNALLAASLSPRGSQPAPRMNESENLRLQGLMRPASMISVDGDNSGGRGGGAGSGAVTRWDRLRVYFINEGSRKVFVGVWMLLHAMVFTFGFLNYQLKDNLVNARATFHITYPIARSAALVLHFDVAFILVPICRNFISMLRRGPLNGVIPFEKNITFHKSVAWSIVFFTSVHIIAHMFNFTFLALVASKTPSGRFVAFLEANFLTGPGATGWVMTAILFIMVWFAIEKRRRANFERFWYSHHLFVVFILWQFHGMFCMIQPDRPPYCSFESIGVFWKYWLVGGVIYIYERILREVRARHRTFVSKVILHPGKVCEMQIKKEKTTTRAGQYIFLNCPEVSYFQWHPFTLTSAPEEDYISVHIRVVGDFTTALAEALGCELPSKEKKADNDIGAVVVKPPLNRVLPRLMIDGPFGSASEDVFKFEVSVLVGAGIGVTPFASILKSVWYRLNFPQGKKSRLSKVYFFWICRDTESFEWFQSLLEAIEQQDLAQYIEIHTYLTARKEDDINNIFAQDVGGERDAVTNLRAPTHYGRPNWPKIFQSIAKKHPVTEAGVFFCGPKALGSALHIQCNENSTADGTKFVWGKENF